MIWGTTSLESGVLSYRMCSETMNTRDASSLMMRVHGAESHGVKVGLTLLTVTENYCSLVVNSMLLNGICYEIV